MLFGAVVMWIALQAAAVDTPGSAWMLAYEGRSTNELVWDHRIKHLIETRIPARLSAQLFEAVYGPPDPVLVSDHRYVTISACVAHFCPMKGFFWIDTATGTGLGAVAQQHEPWENFDDSLRLGSNGMSASGIPTVARRALIDWLTENDLHPGQVQFVGNRGEWQTLDASAFRPRAKYRPAAGGPGFDCADATGVIEQTICGDPTLSADDLEMFETVERMRRSFATTPARAELLDMQEAWRRQRDVECAVAADLKVCLESRYREQSQRLRNWIPKR